MLETLRKINWPEGVQPAGAVIPAALLSQVADYDDLIVEAEKKAEEMRRVAAQEITAKTEQVRREVTNSVKTDFQKLKDLVVWHRDQILQRSSRVCVDVAKIAVGNFMESLDEQKKISTLVGSLIKKLHSKSNIVFVAHPTQIDLLQETLEKGFARVLKKGDFQIKDDNTLELDQIRVSSVDDAFIDISMKNLVGILCDEIEQLEELFNEEIDLSEQVSAITKSVLNRETI
jgi:mannose/fructose/N-acetylgalactosamine-specific phosphotransferase system component IIB